MTNVMTKTSLNQKIIKIANLIQAMKNSVCPKTKVMRRPNISESRIFRSFLSKFPNCGINTRDDNGEVTLIKFFESRFVRSVSEYLSHVPKCGLNTRHDDCEVTLIHLTRAQTLRSDKCATGSTHANGSMTINVIPC